MENITTCYFTKDENGADLPDTDGVKMVMSDGTIWSVPGDTRNRHYQMYLAWKAEPNTTQSE